MAEKLKIIPLGGLNEIGKNMTVLEYGKDMIVVDCGLGFPEDDMYGVDLVIPDVTYLAKNQKKLRGFFITHGHEDHIGALPYVLQAVNAPVHATPLTLGLIKLKLEEHDLVSKTQLVTHHPGDVVKVGCFSVEFIHVNHSIADAVAFAIHTPVGTVIMTGDFKIDPTSEDGMTDLGRFGMLGKEGVYALLCDSTNVERQGYTPSESVVSESLDRHFKGCKNRIIVTTFASNMHRIQAVFNIAHRHGRKVAVTGRSMENILKVATELDYLHLPENTLVDLNQIKSIPKDKLVIVSTGSQGEDMSALYRMAFSSHRQVEIQPGDHIIISASAIPGNEKSISRIINELYRKGAEVIYDKLDRPARLRTRLSGGAEDHPRADEAEVLHSGPRRAASPAEARRAGAPDGHEPEEHPHCGHRLRHRVHAEDVQARGHRPGGQDPRRRHGRRRRRQRRAARPQASGAGRHDRRVRQPLRARTAPSCPARTSSAAALSI